MLVERDNSALLTSEEHFSLREILPKLETAMLEMPQVSCPVIHRFSPGVYIREVCIPANTFAVGHYQNFEHLNVMLKGRVSVLNENGSVTELTAPLIFVGKPGRKIGYIHEDIVWWNIYQTEETDVEKLESRFITKSNEFNSQQLQLFKSEVDTADYKKLLGEFGFTEEQAREQAYNENDIASLPFGGYKIKVADSAIEGKGLFATADIVVGEIIAPARIEGMRTIAGRFANHSVAPNAIMMQSEGLNINLVALKPIAGCKGGKDGEEITVSYRDSLQLTLQLGKGV
ncbi:SET domain containing protein [uncultured Caudovirales phage]|uniref:SET domain containing protein n=1 Tax=uncultured Caudovirales phage TaxID=2100421 RepID=A0A6J5KM53_9CAUD|nr:SET domain containing protein [uncultured Caudovirales phage]